MNEALVKAQAALKEREGQLQNATQNIYTLQSVVANLQGDLAVEKAKVLALTEALNEATAPRLGDAVLHPPVPEKVVRRTRKSARVNGAAMRS